MSKDSDAGASPIDPAAMKAALAWLDKCIALKPGNYVEITDIASVARTLKALLAEPRLAAEPTDAMRAAMREAFDIEYLHGDFIGAIYGTLYAHLTAPKTKTAWEVRYNDGCWSRYYTRGEAIVNLERRLQEGHRRVEIQESEVSA